MGVYNCNECQELMDGESFSCECCGYGEGDGNILCEECSTEACCEKCDESMCVYCLKGSKDQFPCCNMALCRGEDCAEKHVVKTLDCGHKGCNFREDGGCLTCKKDKDTKSEKEAMAEDFKTIISILDKIKSKSIKEKLGNIIGDSENLKRKRLVERVEELEFSLKKARHICEACQCSASHDDDY